jgi:hypothetical protein
MVFFIFKLSKKIDLILSVFLNLSLFFLFLDSFFGLFENKIEFI